MMVEGQSLVTGSGREETDDGWMVNLRFTSLPLLFSGSHSTDEETEVQRSFRPTPLLWGVASGIVLMLGGWIAAFSREWGSLDPQQPTKAL